MQGLLRLLAMPTMARGHVSLQSLQARGLSFCTSQKDGSYNLQEREQLKRQEKEMREAEEARRKRITVTLDLLGRQVLFVTKQLTEQRAGVYK